MANNIKIVWLKGEKINTSSFIKGAAAGLILGIISGILLAPKSGKETREDIQQFFNQMQEKLIKKIGQMKDFSREKYSELVEETVDNYRNLHLSSEKIDEIKDELKKSFYKIKDILGEK